MIDVWEKFQKKITSIGVGNQEENVHEKALPCLTMCPWRVFRNRGFHFTNEAYYNQTYNLSEIVFENELSNFEKKEIKSFNLGRCHMLCYQKNLTEIGRTNITLRKTMDLMGKLSYYKRICTSSIIQVSKQKATFKCVNCSILKSLPLFT